jgi:hypothetical protein
VGLSTVESGVLGSTKEKDFDDGGGLQECSLTVSSSWCISFGLSAVVCELVLLFSVVFVLLRRKSYS